MARSPNPPFPSGDLRRWALDIVEYLQDDAPARTQVQPQSISLEHQRPAELARAIQDGILMYDPALDYPVYSKAGEWWTFDPYAWGEVNPTGLIDGGEVNIGPGPTDVEIIAGLGVIVDSYTDPDARAVTTVVEWPQINEAITAAPATAGSIVYLTIYNTGVPGTPQGTTPVFVGALRQYNAYPSPHVIRDELMLGAVIHDGTEWNDVSFPKVVNNTAESLYDIMNTVLGPMFVIEGGQITEAPLYTLDQAAGVIWQYNRNWQNDHKDPHREAIPAITGVQWRYTNRDFTDVRALTGTVDDDTWDNNGTVEAIPAGSLDVATIQRLYVDVDSNYWVLWGQELYDNAQEAASRINAPIDVPPLLASSFLLGYIVTERGKTDWDLDEAFFIQGGASGTGAASVPITDHGNLTGLAADDHPQYNKWRGEWLPGTYNLNEEVLDSSYLMIANKTTTDRAAPQTVGAPFFVYDGASPTDTILAKTLAVATEYTFVDALFLTSYRVYTISGNSYSTYYQVDGGTVVELRSFVATITGWQTFALSDVLVPAGTVFTLAVRIVEPDPTPTTFVGNWNYTTPNNEAVPGAGVIIQATREIASFRINVVDSDAVDRRAELLTLTTGDVIDGAGVRWSIAGIADNTTWFDFTVVPGAQGSPNGIQSFTFETVVATPITTVVDPNFWAANADVRGVFSVDGGANTFTQNAYGIDIEVQNASISPDWDFKAVSGSSGGGGGGDFVLKAGDTMTGDLLFTGAGWRADAHSYMEFDAGFAQYSRAIFCVTNFGDTGFIRGYHNSGSYTAMEITVSQSGSLFSFRSDGIGYAPGGWQTGSSVEVKTDINLVASPLDIIGQLTAYNYLRTDLKDYDGNATIRQTGLLVEDVAAVLPDAVSDMPMYGNPEDTREVTGTLGTYDPTQVLAVAINAIKELTARLEAAEDRITELEL